jgi:broad specificity phosphatase PhoE
VGHPGRGLTLSSSPRDAERPSGAAPLIPPGLDAILVLLRHGETEFIVQRRFQGQMETPLTVRGERQARLSGARLAHPRSTAPLPIPDEPPHLVVSSPLQRTWRSAELVAAEFGAAGRPTPPPRPEPDLAEVAQGEWEGLTDTEITARFGDTLAGWRRWPERYHAPGGESLAQVRERVTRALVNLLGQLADGTQPGTMDRHQVLGYADDSHQEPRWALVVGHGGIFRVALCALLNLPDEHFWNFDFGLGAITVVEIRAGRAVVRALNLEDHLAPAGGGGAVEPANERTETRDATGAL